MIEESKSCYTSLRRAIVSGGEEAHNSTGSGARGEGGGQAWAGSRAHLPVQTGLLYHCR